MAGGAPATPPHRGTWLPSGKDSPQQRGSPPWRKAVHVTGSKVRGVGNTAHGIVFTELHRPVPRGAWSLNALPSSCPHPAGPRPPPTPKHNRPSLTQCRAPPVSVLSSTFPALYLARLGPAPPTPHAPLQALCSLPNGAPSSSAPRRGTRASHPQRRPAGRTGRAPVVLPEVRLPRGVLRPLGGAGPRTHLPQRGCGHDPCGG